MHFGPIVAHNSYASLTLSKRLFYLTPMPCVFHVFPTSVLFSIGQFRASVVGAFVVNKSDPKLKLVYTSNFVLRTSDRSHSLVQPVLPTAVSLIYGGSHTFSAICCAVGFDDCVLNHGQSSSSNTQRNSSSKQQDNENWAHTWVAERRDTEN
eukprot:3334574-Amphidinium_carterae.1